MKDLGLRFLGYKTNIWFSQREIDYIQDSRKGDIFPHYTEENGGDWVTVKIIIRRMKEVNQDPTKEYAG